ncbi:cadherin-like protein 26 isoform X2 [Brachyhypopomus gauderio]|uniref:cadherin-like protein 26 isoform X2 n=1 Tax=Brachyhypopomus gauderio TaxID=698409 RepID=UPI004042265F
MRMSPGFLLLLTLWAETSPSKRRQQDGVTRDTVLVRSKRRWVLSTIELEEEDPGPFPKLATELFNDKEINHTLKFSISGQGVNEDPVGVFTINDRTGQVFMHKPIDRELYPFFYVKFDVQDRVTGQILDKTLAFNVAIKDKNDNAPSFIPDVLQTHVPENIKEGQLPISLQAKDRDEKDTDNSRMSMKVVSQDPAQPQISLKAVPNTMRDNEVRQLILSGCFDYDKANKYTLLVEAQDLGKPSLSSTATVLIDITDSNTHTPVFNASTYNAQVIEMQSNKEILRVAVHDKDTPNTPGSKAVYSIIKGNEQGNYKIETDPVTNEGVLTVIKGKDYEKTTLTELEIAVENEEPLFMCVDGKPVTPVPESAKTPSTAKVLVKVIDVNDAPVFSKKIHTVYRKEEDEPGDVLYQPTVTDEDSDINNIRFKLAEDPADWMTIDPKTGTVTSKKKMDRESPFVKNSTYTVVINAVDNGEPPGTGTSTLVVHLGDVNDNTPHLIANRSVMCGNKDDRVVVEPNDMDAEPFGGPFSFSLGTDDKDLMDTWKIHPNTGPRTSLVSQQSLAYGNYSVPLRIEDQQGAAAHRIVHVVVCDCGEGDECRSLLPRSSRLHPVAVLALLAALLPLLFCLCFLCICRFNEKIFKGDLQHNGEQTLIIYNEEGGGSLIRADPNVIQTMQTSSTLALNARNTLEYNGAWANGATMKSSGKETNWGVNRTYTTRTNRYSGTYRTVSRSDWNIEGHLDRKLFEISEDLLDIPPCGPHHYNDEGSDSRCPSLDKLSFGTGREDLDFLQDLGPQFCTLSGICREAMEEKRMNL